MLLNLLAGSRGGGGGTGNGVKGAIAVDPSPHWRQCIEGLEAMWLQFTSEPWARHQRSTDKGTLTFLPEVIVRHFPGPLDFGVTK